MLKPARTFCAVPFCDDISRLEADIAVIGAPHGTPYKPGEASHAANGAKAVRETLEWFSIGPEQLDLDTGETVFGGARVVDVGDVEGDLGDGPGNRARIAAATKSVLARGAVPLLLGGDDSTPIPFLQGFEGHSVLGGGKLTVVQIDAHLDWREEREGERFGYSSTMRRASEMGWVERIIQIGARGPGSARPSDLADLRRWGVHLHTARDVHERGIQPALAQIPEGARVVLTVDVDGIDPLLVPGVILPAFGGLGYQQMLDVIHGIARRAQLVGVDFVEFVPERDPHGLGARAIARLACNAIVAIARQRRR